MTRGYSNQTCLKFLVPLSLFLILTFPSSLAEKAEVSPLVLQRLKNVLTQSECYYFIEFFMEVATPKQNRDWAWNRMEEFGLWPSPINCSPALDAWSRDLFPPLIHDGDEEDKRIQASSLLDRALRYAELTDTEEWKKLHPNILNQDLDSKHLGPMHHHEQGHEKIEQLPVQSQTLSPYSLEIESPEFPSIHGQGHKGHGIELEQIRSDSFDHESQEIPSARDQSHKGPEGHDDTNSVGTELDLIRSDSVDHESIETPSGHGQSNKGHEGQDKNPIGTEIDLIRSDSVDLESLEIPSRHGQSHKDHEYEGHDTHPTGIESDLIRSDSVDLESPEIHSIHDRSHKGREGHDTHPTDIESDLIRSDSADHESPGIPSRRGQSHKSHEGYDRHPADIESDQIRADSSEYEPQHQPHPHDSDFDNELRPMNDHDLPYDDIEEIFRRKAEEENKFRLNHEAHALRHIEILKSETAKSEGQTLVPSLKIQFILSLTGSRSSCQLYFWIVFYYSLSTTTGGLFVI